MGGKRVSSASPSILERLFTCLLHQGVVMAGSLGRSGAKIVSRLQRHAYFVERDQVGRQSRQLVDDQRPTRRPAFVVLFEVQRDYTERHGLPSAGAPDFARYLSVPPLGFCVAPPGEVAGAVGSAPLAMAAARGHR